MELISHYNLKHAAVFRSDLANNRVQTDFRQAPVRLGWNLVGLKLCLDSTLSLGQVQIQNFVRFVGLYSGSDPIFRPT